MQKEEPFLKKQNMMLKKQVEQQNEELSFVTWYIQMFENGVNTKNLMKEIMEAKAEIKFLKES